MITLRFKFILLNSKGKVCIRLNWPIRPGLIPVSVARYFYFPQDGMLVHCRVTPSVKSRFDGTHLYTWVERGTVRVESPKNATQCPRLGFEPGSLDLDTSTIAIRAPHLRN